MEIFDIDTLTKDSSGNYNLNQTTFELILTGAVRFGSYEVQKGEEMRIDLVCNSIYQNIEYCDILLNVNNIDNPLNIKEGSVILYPINDIDILRYSAPDNVDINKVLANSNKATRKDQSRKQYAENNLNLPPTVLEESTNQFNIDNPNSIVLGTGLF
jgi:hypothetical protein